MNKTYNKKSFLKALTKLSDQARLIIALLCLEIVKPIVPEPYRLALLKALASTAEALVSGKTDIDLEVERLLEKDKKS